jgi:hypothetical protein
MSACVKCGHNPDADVRAAWLFSVDHDIESANQHTFNVGATRWRYGKARDAWQWELRAARLLHRIPTHHGNGRRRVTITRRYHGRQRPYDRDNLAMGAKLVVDAMVREGLLIDDSERHAEIHYQQEPGTGTTFVIEELAS